MDSVQDIIYSPIPTKPETAGQESASDDRQPSPVIKKVIKKKLFDDARAKVVRRRVGLELEIRLLFSSAA